MKNKLYKLSIALLPLFLFVVLAFLLLANSFSYSDTDLAWHLRIGQDIVESAQAPTINYYNYTLAGSNWVDHEWLLNALMANIYNFTNYPGLHLFFVIIALLAFFLAWKRANSLGGRDGLTSYLGIFFILAAFLASRAHLGLRVQEIGLLGLAFLFLIFSNYSKYRIYYFFLPLVFLLWANLHGSFILGLLLFGAFSLYAFLSPYLRRCILFKQFSIAQFNFKDKKQLVLIFVLSSVATLINPYGLGLYSFLAGYTDIFYMTYIREWQGQFVFPLYYAQILYLSLALALVVMYLWQRRHKELSLSLWDSALSILFFILAFKSRRHFPIFALASLPVVVIAARSLILEAEIKFKESIRILFVYFIIIASAIFVVYQAVIMPWRQDAINDYCGRKYPCGAVKYLQTHSETNNLRLFNEYNWGGYLIGAYPEKQSFIDGRMPQAAFREHTILEEYLKIRQADSQAQMLLDEYNIGLVLINGHNSNFKLKPWETFFFRVTDGDLELPDSLREYLQAAPQWQEVYRDNLSIIYERR